MKTTIDLYTFRDMFQGKRPDDFSYEGLEALFDYLEELEQGTEEEMELDVIGICCDFCEYENAIEAASNYFNFEGMTYDEETGEELETPEEVEQKAIEYLEENTQVIVFDSGVIIQNF